MGKIRRYILSKQIMSGGEHVLVSRSGNHMSVFPFLFLCISQNKSWCMVVVFAINEITMEVGAELSACRCAGVGAGG